jgi:thioredoxin reductase
VEDVIIVGGGPAGLTAALYLGRACRKVVVIDSNQPRNAASQGMHGFISRDGMQPGEFREVTRQQLAAYPGVTFLDAAVAEVKQCESGFEIVVEGGERRYTRKLLLATGVRDELPQIEGFSRWWGRGVYHCPYCDGWEVRNLPLAVYGRGEDAFRRTKLLTAWSRKAALYSDGPAELSAAQRQQLEAAGITICEARITRLAGETRLEKIIFEDGSSVECRGLFAKPAQQQQSAFARSLGLELDEHNLVKANGGGRPKVYGLFVAGDTSALAQQVVLAAASGAMAAMQINEELVTETFNNFN